MQCEVAKFSMKQVHVQIGNELIDGDIQMNQKVDDSGVLAEPPIVIGNLADGRLTYKQLRVDGTIEVTISTVADPDSLRIELQMFPPGAFPVPGAPNFVVAAKEKDKEPGGVWTFPLSFTVDVSALRDRFSATGAYVEWELAFVVYDSFGNDDTSNPHTSIFVDLTAPYQTQPGNGNRTGGRPPALRPSTPPVPATIDDAWLNDPTNINGLNLVIPTAYTRFEEGKDKAAVYISRLTTFPLMRTEQPAYSGTLPALGVVNVSLTFLSGLPDGRYYYAYELEDAPGNISNNSLITPIFQVVRAPAPVLNPPRIPVTGADGRTPITLRTVNDPAPSRAVMEIDVHGTWLPTDRIIPYMQAVGSQNPVPVSEIPVGTGNPVLQFLLTYEKLKEVFGSDDGQDEVEFSFWCELARSSITPNPTSPSRFALVDFAYGGPEQPNLPDLENINIPAVIVQGVGSPTPPPSIR